MRQIYNMNGDCWPAESHSAEMSATSPSSANSPNTPTPSSDCDCMPTSNQQGKIYNSFLEAMQMAVNGGGSGSAGAGTCGPTTSDLTKCFQTSCKTGSNRLSLANLVPSRLEFFLEFSFFSYRFSTKKIIILSLSLISLLLDEIFKFLAHFLLWERGIEGGGWSEGSRKKW